MKSIFRKCWLATVCGVFSSFSVNAQIATWHVHPKFDSIRMLENAIICGKNEGKTYFWSTKGGENQEIHVTDVQIKDASFKDDCIVLLEAGTPNVYGFMTRDGEFISLKNEGYVIANNYPYFSDGYLLVAKSQVVGKESILLNYYLDKKGKPIYGPFASAQPFSHGYATVTKFKNMEKNPKDVFYDYISVNSSEVILSNTNRDDITFASSLNENGEAIVVVEKKVYFCRICADEWTQLYTDAVDGKTEKEKKKLMVLTPSSHADLADRGDEICLTIRQGELAFDKLLHLRSIRYNGKEEENFPTKEIAPYILTSDIGKTEAKEGLYGLTYKFDPLMPEQFEEIVCRDGDIAVVKYKGKYGVLKVNPHDKFIISVNDGKGNEKGIGFKHRTQDAKLEILFPVNIDPRNAKLLAIDGVNQCKIRTGSREIIKNDETNGLRYDCSLTIPQDDLPSDQTTCKPYNFQVVYECLDGLNDGLMSKVHEVCINEWYVKLYDVEIKEPNFDVDINQDKIRINFELKRSAMTSDEDYANFFYVDASSDDGQSVYECTSVSTGKYYFDMPIGEQKLLNFEIHISEEGCPPNVYPHTISVDFQENEAGEPQGQTKTVSIVKRSKATSGSKSVSTPKPVSTPKSVSTPKRDPVPVNWDNDL